MRIVPDQRLNTLLHIGCEYAHARRFDDALRLFHMVVKYDPDHPDAFYNMASCYSQLGRKDRALACLKEHKRLNEAEPVQDLDITVPLRSPLQEADPEIVARLLAKLRVLTSEQTALLAAEFQTEVPAYLADFPFDSDAYVGLFLNAKSSQGKATARWSLAMLDMLWPEFPMRQELESVRRQVYGEHPLDDAVSSHLSAISSIRQLQERDEGNEAFREALYRGHLALGGLYRLQENIGRSMDNEQAALQIAEEFLRLHPDNRAAKESAERSRANIARLRAAK
ncbi:MAG TPA: tetratricopeptide repeat protein [Thermoanaerobaculia bacterium]|nr:tetratricopeptide repeat protein [Thermoanaerobaculia bacterium]